MSIRDDRDLVGRAVLGKDPAKPWGAVNSSRGVRTGRDRKWLPFVDTYRTLCMDPPPTMRAVFEQLQGLPRAG